MCIGLARRLFLDGFASQTFGYQWKRSMFDCVRRLYCVLWTRNPYFTIVQLSLRCRCYTKHGAHVSHAHRVHFMVASRDATHRLNALIDLVSACDKMNIIRSFEDNYSVIPWLGRRELRPPSRREIRIKVLYLEIWTFAHLPNKSIEWFIRAAL